ncbi:MAG TPA: tripartite tricarboxylate transporter substrate binding protein [Burkholderiales bacterium]|nr:tripartite tricarboxylate transporter substrate binding protein [Burkholderiales bacterium]
MFRSAIAGACLAAFALGAFAQQPYPNRPIRLIIPLAPGGTTDILARTIGPQLSSGLGQPVVAENRAGAGGVVGAEVAAKAPPDGYTILLISGDTYNVNALLYAKLPFDARKDLKPVSVLAASPNMLSVHPSLPAKTVGELVALSKKRPGELNYGVGGTAGMLRMELIKLNTGLNITNIPYKGSGPALIDLVAGQIHAGFFNFVASAPFVESGRLRGIIVSGTKRTEKLPAIPTAKEAGIAGFEENAGYMIMVPGATPTDVVARLHKEILRAINTPEVKSRLAAEGSEVIGSTTEQATASLNRHLDQMADLIRRTGIKL